MNPATRKITPRLSSACTTLDTHSGPTMLAPGNNGKNLHHAPSMTCIMKPTVMRWGKASAAGVQRDRKISGPLHKRRTPARRLKRGSSQKKNGKAPREVATGHPKGVPACGVTTYLLNSIMGLAWLMPHQHFKSAIGGTAGFP